MSAQDDCIQFIIAFELFSEALCALAARAEDVGQFSRLAKTDPEIKRLKGQTRKLFERIYALVAGRFDLPILPVYVPLRKKISVRGKAFASDAGFPTEIRVYPIEAPNKSYESWRPSDLSCSSVVNVFDTFVHEMAHVLEAKRYRRMSHGSNFTKARRDIEEVLREYGFGNVLK